MKEATLISLTNTLDMADDRPAEAPITVEYGSKEAPLLRSQLALQALAERKLTMTNYLHMKVQEQDWHGVADAAMDLRDIEAAVAVWNEVQDE